MSMPNSDQLLDLFLSGSLPHIGLIPINADVFALFPEDLGIMTICRFTSIVDFVYSNRVLAATKKGKIKKNMFLF